MRFAHAVERQEAETHLLSVCSLYALWGYVYGALAHLKVLALTDSKVVGSSFLARSLARFFAESLRKGYLW